MFVFFFFSKVILKWLGIYEFLPSSDFIKWIGDYMCQDEAVTHAVCENIIFLLAGISDQLNAVNDRKLHFFC